MLLSTTNVTCDCTLQRLKFNLTSFHLSAQPQPNRITNLKKNLIQIQGRINKWFFSFFQSKQKKNWKKSLTTSQILEDSIIFILRIIYIAHFIQKQRVLIWHRLVSVPGTTLYIFCICNVLVQVYWYMLYKQTLNYYSFSSFTTILSNFSPFC